MSALPLVPEPIPASDASSPRVVVVAPPDHPQRAAIEDFIAAVYHARFGARVRAWAPTLIALSVDGKIAAAAGYRRANQTLFLERYLAEPVEVAIRARTGIEIPRDAVVEIGHFASARHGEGRRLMTLLARHLHAAGARWAATTATKELRRLYARIGVRAWWLAEATREMAGPSAADWGDYYDHAPAVVAGSIARNLARLEGRAG